VSDDIETPATKKEETSPKAAEPQKATQSRASDSAVGSDEYMD
tara:strand:- start:90 stop:218 length:129 start_codon:yes stop_codon:yes gene_type:complete